jgi:hypothetical protein
MVFDNWKTPAPFDNENWNVGAMDSQSVTLYKKMDLLNYAGTQLKLRVDRTVSILSRDQVNGLAGTNESDDSLYAAGYETKNVLTNTGEQEWTESSGMPCIWILDMFKPSSSNYYRCPFQKYKSRGF